MARGLDLTGKRFGMLTVLGRTSQNQNGCVLWRCRCDCGSEVLVTSKRLRRGTVTSCGCRRKTGFRGIADITGRRFGRLVAVSPTPRRDKKGSVYWLCRCDCGNELEITENALVYGNYRSCGCLKQDLQREITNRLHRIDGTCVEWLEKRKHRSDNRSGFRGVFLLKNGKYRVSIGFKKKRFYLGVFGTYEEAVTARLEAEEKIHSAFVRAYYLWRAYSDPLPEEERTPLEFNVEKRGNEFIITSNVELFTDLPSRKAQ